MASQTCDLTDRENQTTRANRASLLDLPDDEFRDRLEARLMRVLQAEEYVRRVLTARAGGVDPAPAHVGLCVKLVLGDDGA